jgi:uncharacterized protein YcfJ
MSQEQNMEAIKSTRIHPLMAAAAVSVVIVSLAGTAAITGLLPSSRGASNDVAPVAMQPVAAYPGAPAGAALPLAAGQALAPQALQAVPAGYVQPGVAYAQPAGYAQPGAYAQPVAYAQPAVAAAQPAPVVIKETVIREVPVKQAARPVRHHTSYAQHSAPVYREPAPQPNYVAIGTGAVVGGLLGNQVGHGNGRKLATIAGVIGGGMLGNQIANQNR